MSKATRRKKRILFISAASVFSGGDKHLVDLARRLDFSAVQPTILCTGTDPFTRVLDEQLTLGLRIETGLSRSSFLRALLRFRKNKPDAIVFITGNIGAFPWYQFLAARLSGAKRVCAIYHSFSPVLEPVSRSGNLLRYLARRTFGYRARYMLEARVAGALTHCSICVSDNLRELLVSAFGFPASKAVTVRNGIDFRYFGVQDTQAQSLRRELGIGSDDVLVVAACRLVPLKGVDILLHAISALRHEVPNLRCVIVGEGSSGEDLREIANEMDLGRRVFFVGFKDDVRAYLQASDIFVNPSSASCVECFPLSVLEAMACGLPCIGARTGGVPEIISDQEDGLLVAPGSIEELSAAIKRLACNTTERERMGLRAKEKVQGHFDIEQSMRRIISILFQAKGNWALQPAMPAHENASLARRELTATEARK